MAIALAGVMLATAAATAPALGDRRGDGIQADHAKTAHRALRANRATKALRANRTLRANRAGVADRARRLTCTNPCVVGVGGEQALRLEANSSPNLIGGFAGNAVTAGAEGATISGGGEDAFAGTNRVTDDFGTVGGGKGNQAGDGAGTTTDRRFATVGGGTGNTASGSDSTVAGGNSNGATAFAATVAGGRSNVASDINATVGGGFFSRASGERATVGGGFNNTASALGATVAGGQSNTASDEVATVGGGDGNAASERFTTVGGGGANTANRHGATVAGGQVNTATEDWATVGGGVNNHATGIAATVPGGTLNAANGLGSFAAGRRAKANHDGTFVWADSEFADMTSSGVNQFIARASGNFFFQSDSSLDNQGGFINTSTGAFLTTGGTWTNASDAAAKADFAPVEPTEVLDKVAELPVQTWRYTAEDGVRHIGPTAQDFHAAFGVGPDDTHIATVDADGVALAAIQGLNEKVDARNQQLEAQVAELRSQISADDQVLAVANTAASGVPVWVLVLAAVSALGFGLGVGMGLRKVSPDA